MYLKFSIKKEDSFKLILSSLKGETYETEKQKTSQQQKQ